MGVLVQRELAPTFAGTAEILADGSAEVIMTDGSAARLMTGWEHGRRTVVDPSADPPSPPAGTEAEVSLLAAALARETAAALGDNLIEWALAAGRIWLLQSRRIRRPRPAPQPVSAARSPVTSQALIRAARYPGELSERWLLPWVVAWDRGIPAAKAQAARPDREPSAAWQLMCELSDQLTAQVWRTPAGRAGLVADQIRANLRAGGPAPAGLSRLAAPDPGLVARFAEAAWELIAHLRQRGTVTSAGEFWALPADIGPLLGGGPYADAHARSVRAALAWEPYLFESVTALGHRWAGTPVSAGAGCGRAVLASDLASSVSRPGSLPVRSVLVADYPLPRYAPLLMGAAGLVTNGGSGAAHLMTVASSLGVPAVAGCDLTSLIRESVDTYVAVDGGTGTIAVLAEPAAAPAWDGLSLARSGGWPRG